MQEIICHNKKFSYDNFFVYDENNNKLFALSNKTTSEIIEILVIYKLGVSFGRLQKQNELLEIFK